MGRSVLTNGDDQRVSYNVKPLQQQIGDLTKLGTTDKTSLVNALNEVKSEKEDSSLIGDLTELNTSDKSNLVAAINSNASELADISLDARMPLHGLTPAKGDGTTDDTSALQAMVDYLGTLGGGTLFLPIGVYKTTAQITWRTLVSLKGSGIGKSIIKPYGQGFAAIGFDSTWSNANNPFMYCNFDNFEIDGTNFTNTVMDAATKGIFIQYMRRCTFRDLYIHDTVGTGLGTDFLDECTIDNVVTFNCGRLWTSGGMGQAGIGIGTGGMTDENFIITNCQTRNSGQFGIFVENQYPSQDNPTVLGKPKNILITNCIARNGRNDGINIRGGENVTISNCISEGNTRYGISISWDLTNISIDNNSANLNGSDGIYFANGNHTKDKIYITNNRALNNTGCGIKVDTTLGTYINIGITNNKASGNTVGIKGLSTGNITGLNIECNEVWSNSSDGINLENSASGVKIKDNKIYNNTSGDGIHLSGAYTNSQFDNNFVYGNNRGIIQSAASVITNGSLRNNQCNNTTTNYVINTTNISMINDQSSPSGKITLNTNSYVVLPNQVGDFSSQTSFAFEFKFKLTLGVGTQCILSKTNTSYVGGSANPQGWDIRTSSTGKLLIEGFATDVGTQNYQMGSTSLVAGTIYWARITYNGTSFSILLSTDGVNYTSETLTSTGTNANLLTAIQNSLNVNTYIGQVYLGTSGYTYHFVGDIYYIKISKGSTSTTSPTIYYPFLNYGVNQNVVDTVVGYNGSSWYGAIQSAVY